MRQPDFWWRKTPVARITATAFAPLGFLYGESVAWKRRRSKPYRAHIPVICVGNLTVGGSGKTPVAIAIARMLLQQGVSPAFLLRGYGRRARDTFVVDAGSDDVSTAGDEALLLSRVAPTIVSVDRAAGARMAEKLAVQVIIMDDGYQNFSLHKDLPIVVIDGETGFGNGRMIPAGPLREPVKRGLQRAYAAVVVGEGDPPLPRFERPILRARLSTTMRLDGERVVGFAGIGRPEKFLTTLRETGADVVAFQSFADHQIYSPADIAALRDRAARARAMLITTEKDLVRLTAEERADIAVLAVRAVFDDEAELERLLAPVLAKADVAA